MQCRAGLARSLLHIAFILKWCHCSYRTKHIILTLLILMTTVILFAVVWSAGPGIFRASSLDHPIVNVSGGNGVILSPAVLSCRWNLARRLHAPEHAPNTTNVVFEVPEHLVFSLPGEDDAEERREAEGEGGRELLTKVWAVLQREGIAVLRTPWAAQQQGQGQGQQPPVDIDTALLRVVSRLNCTPHMHSATAGSVWDVRPVHDKVEPSSASEIATETDTEIPTETETDTETETGEQLLPLNPRSKTAEAFGMHTDCSFEAPPPRQGLPLMTLPSLPPLSPLPRSLLSVSNVCCL